MLLWLLILTGLYIVVFLLFSLKWLHNQIIEIDLRPSMTQFLIVAIFTPVMLITMHFSTYQGSHIDSFENEMNIEAMRYSNLEIKYNKLKNRLNFVEQLSMNEMINFDQLIVSAENYNDSLLAYRESYLKLESLVDKYNSSLFIYHANQYNYFESDNEFLIAYLEQLNTKKEITPDSRKRLKQLFQNLEFNSIQTNHDNLNMLHEEIISKIHTFQYLIWLSGIFISLLIFYAIVFIFKIYYFKKIIFKKIEKFHSIKIFKKALDEDDDLEKIEKKLNFVFNSTNENVSIFKRINNLFLIDKLLQLALNKKEMQHALEIWQMVVTESREVNNNRGLSAGENPPDP